MKKYVLTLLTALVAMIAFSSCGKDDDDIELQYTIETDASPDNLKIRYSSPDPACVPKSFEVIANSCESQATLKFTNATLISIVLLGASTDSYVSMTGRWEARIIDGNSLAITLDEIESGGEDDYEVDISELRLVAQTNKGTVTTRLNVFRLLHTTNPVS